VLNATSLRAFHRALALGLLRAHAFACRKFVFARPSTSAVLAAMKASKTKGTALKASKAPRPTAGRAPKGGARAATKTATKKSAKPKSKSTPKPVTPPAASHPSKAKGMAAEKLVPAQVDPASGLKGKVFKNLSCSLKLIDLGQNSECASRHLHLTTHRLMWESPKLLCTHIHTRAL